MVYSVKNAVRSPLVKNRLSALLVVGNKKVQNLDTSTLLSSLVFYTFKEDIDH